MTKTANVNKLTSIFPLTGPTVVNVVYRNLPSGTFTTAATNITINQDGTLATPVSFPIDINTLYLVQAQDQQCNAVASELLQYPCAQTCPPGWTLSDDGSYCFMLQTIAATPPANQQDAVSVTVNTYGVCGSYIFDPGYNVNGTGTTTKISTANPFWINGTSGCLGTGTTTAGPVNRLGIWGPGGGPNQTVGFSVCFNITQTGTYYVGMAGDDYYTMQIDGNTVIQADPTALDIQFGIPPPPGIGGSTFRAFCIYPVTLQAGQHVLAVVGVNGSLPAPNPGMIAAEIYNNTPAQIAAATSIADLNIIFSTQNMVGLPITIGTFGWTCPDGYTLNQCGSPFTCSKQITMPSTC